MGFYAPATIVSDARRIGVEVLPVDAQKSDWDCRLEARTRGTTCAPGATRAPAETPAPRYAVRMGLRYVKGLSQSEGERIVVARAGDGTRESAGGGGDRRPGACAFRSIADLASRTGLEKHHLVRLAEAGALEGLSPGRRQALWEVRGLDVPAAPRLPLKRSEQEVGFAPLSLFENITWDYAATEHSPRGHPLAPLRLELTAQGLPDARTLNRMPGGTRVRYAGLAVCRQQPMTAGGVVFMTLEDETGFVNLVLWRDIYQKHRIVARTTAFLGVTGRLQVESGVVHLMGESLWIPQVRTQPHEVRSRDFH